MASPVAAVGRTFCPRAVARTTSVVQPPLLCLAAGPLSALSSRALSVPLSPRASTHVAMRAFAALKYRLVSSTHSPPPYSLLLSVT